MEYELEEIKKLRRKHNLTQTGLSKLAGVSQSLIAKIESGNLDPSYSKVRKILDVLNSLTEKNEAKVADFIQRRIIFSSPNELVSEAAKKMRKHEISQLPVIERNKVIGLVSEADILEIISKGREISKIKLEDIMEDAPPLIPESTPVKVVMELLKFSPIIVVLDNGKISGVITKSDLLRNVRTFH